MGVFTFVCKHQGGKWSAKQHDGDLEGSAASTYDLERDLIQAALSSGASGGVQTSFSQITPNAAVFQVIVGGGSFVAAAPSGGAPSGGAPAAAAAPAESKKEEVVEESDDDMGLGLFD